MSVMPGAARSLPVAVEDHRVLVGEVFDDVVVEHPRS